jgi:hypothetical protein
VSRKSIIFSPSPKVSELITEVANTLNIKIHKIIMLPVILYGCETWSLTLKEEHNLKMCENRVLRRISGPKTKERAEGCR